MDIGFIGLGSMGARMATMMLDSGHHLTVWARRPASLEAFVGRCVIADSPAGVGAAADLVGICVWDEHDVDEVLLGPRGVLAGMRPGGVVAIHSTISPAACHRLQSEADRHHVDLLDAPVSLGSTAPKLLVMVGGDADVVARCREAFDSFGDPVVHLGPVGSGQIAKLVNNTLLAATVGLADDAIALGRELDLDQDALATALSAGSSRGTWCGLLAGRRAAGVRAAGVRAATGPPSGRANEWARKDVGLALDLAVGAGIGAQREIFRLASRGIDALDAP